MSTRWYAFHIPHPSAECEPNRASDKYWPKKYTCKSLKGCVVVLAAPHRFPFRENVKLHPLLRRQIGPEGRGAIFGVVDNRFFAKGALKLLMLITLLFSSRTQYHCQVNSTGIACPSFLEFYFEGFYRMFLNARREHTSLYSPIKRCWFAICVDVEVHL